METIFLIAAILGIVASLIVIGNASFQFVMRLLTRYYSRLSDLSKKAIDDRTEQVRPELEAWWFFEGQSVAEEYAAKAAAEQMRSTVEGEPEEAVDFLHALHEGISDMQRQAMIERLHHMVVEFGVHVATRDLTDRHLDVFRRSARRIKHPSPEYLQEMIEDIERIHTRMSENLSDIGYDIPALEKTFVDIGNSVIK